ELTPISSFRVGAAARLDGRDQAIGAVIAVLPDDARVGGPRFVVLLHLIACRIVFVRPVGVGRQLVVRPWLLPVLRLPGQAIPELTPISSALPCETDKN